MKKLHFILALVIGLFGLSNCEDRDKEDVIKLTYEDLPSSSQEFLKQYFPHNKIESITLDKLKETGDLRSSGDYEKTVVELMLYVALEDDITIIFYPRDGSWKHIEARNGLPESATALIHVNRELKEKEPQAKIIALSPSYWRTIVITLDNGRRYAETEQFTFSGSILAEVGISNEKVAAKLTEFGKRNQLDSAFATGLWFKITEDKGVVYRFFIGDVLILTFNDKGDWVHGQIESYDRFLPSAVDDLLTKIAENELPESVGEAVRRVGNKGKIEIISCYNNGYYGFKFDNVDLLVNEKSGIMPPPLEMTNKLISDYFEIPYMLVTNPVYRVNVAAYGYNYTYFYQRGIDYLYIRRDMYNNLTEIHAFQSDKDKQVDIGLPLKLLADILPPQITDYMNENYKGEEVYRMNFDKGDGYILYIDKYYLSFTEEGRFRGKGEWSGRL